MAMLTAIQKAVEDSKVSVLVIDSGLINKDVIADDTEDLVKATELTLDQLDTFVAERSVSYDLLQLDTNRVVPILYIDKDNNGENDTTHEDPLTENKLSLSKALEQQRSNDLITALSTRRDLKDVLNRYCDSVHNSNESDPNPDLFLELVDELNEKLSKDKNFQDFDKTILYEKIKYHSELKLSEHIWKRINNKCQNDEINFSSLSKIPLYKLAPSLFDIKFKNFYLSNIIKWENRISKATLKFQNFLTSLTYKEKVNSLLLMLDDLNYHNMMDADTLISILSVVVCRAKTRNLSSQIYFLQNFIKDKDSVKFGIMGYIISTLIAILIYIQDNITNLLKYAKELKLFLSDLSNNSEKNEYLEEFIRYRSPNGESLLSICIRKHYNKTLLLLLSKYEKFFPMDDILDDKDLSSNTLLHTAIKHNNDTALLILSKILISSCSEPEILKYINKIDKHKRSAIYYISSKSQRFFIKIFGKNIKWHIEDNKKITPLCYLLINKNILNDSDNYTSIIEFILFYTYKYSINPQHYLNRHIDNKTNNNILHLLRDTDDNINKILKKFKNIDHLLNMQNNIGLTPIMVAIKNKRINVLKLLLSFKNILLWKCDSAESLNLWDLADNNEEIIHLLDEHLLIIPSTEKHTSIFECNSLDMESAKLFLSYRRESSTSLVNSSDASPIVETKIFHCKTIIGIAKIFLEKDHTTFLPWLTIIEQMNKLFKTNNNNIVLKRLHKHFFLQFLTNCLNLYVFINHDKLDLASFKNEINLQAFIKINHKKYKKDTTFIKPRKRDMKIYQPNEIEIIQTFLQFNNSEIENLLSSLLLVKKILIAIKFKHKNLQLNRQKFSQFISNLPQFSILADYIYHPHMFHSNEKLYTLIINDIIFFEQVVTILHRNIRALSNGAISIWWQHYQRFENFKSRYLNRFPYRTAEYLLKLLQKNIRTVPKDIKIQEERILLGNILDIWNTLQRFGGKINIEHEKLAVELSNFMNVKEKLWHDIIIKRIALNTVKVLRAQKAFWEDWKYEFKKTSNSI